MIVANGKRLFRRTREQVECECDTCGNRFMLAEPRASNQNVHFCNGECFKRGSSLGSKFVENRQRTTLAKYGVVSTSQLPEVRKRKSELMKEWIATTDIEKRRKQTNLERYGVENPYRAAHVREKVKRLYGDENPFKTKLGQQKAKETIRARYGVDCLFRLKRYQGLGNSPDAIRKRQANIRKNGGMKRSKIETRFYEALCRLFGRDDIKRDVSVNGWSIDCHIVSLDIYLQFDGVYFHGLDRPFEKITSPVIRRTFLRDAEQGKWFASNGKILVRVTDVDYLLHGEDDLFVFNCIADNLEQKAICLAS